MPQLRALIEAVPLGSVLDGELSPAAVGRQLRFEVVLPPPPKQRQDCSEEQAAALCEHILESMQAPITVIDRQIKGEVAIGVALNDSGEELLRNAVAALEKTKSPRKEGPSRKRGMSRS